METPRRRSTRLKHQTSDDDSSAASSKASRSSTRVSARAAGVDVGNNEIGTPARERRTRSNSTSVGETPPSERRRSTRSTSKSDASESKADAAIANDKTETPTKARRAKSNSGDIGRKSAKKSVAKSPNKLDVIPEVLDANDAEETAMPHAQAAVEIASPVRTALDFAEPVESSIDAHNNHDNSINENAAQENSANKKKKTRIRHHKKTHTTHMINHQPSETPVTVSPFKPALKQKPIFHAHVHRLRFMKLFPKPIVAMASSLPYMHRHQHPSEQKTPQQSHSKSTNKLHQLLAISRQGGSVELVDPQERWITLGRVPGVRRREVDALIWVCASEDRGGDRTTASVAPDGPDPVIPTAVDNASRPHLIGASRDGTLFLLDFATQRQTHVVGSGAGGVFCLASLSTKGTFGRHSGSSREYFAAGCEDGTIKVYCFKNGLNLVATLPSVGNAVLSLAWLGNKNSACDGSDVLGGSVIFAGVADGTIRRFDCVASMASTSISTGFVLSTSDVLGTRTSSSSVVYRWKSTLRMTVENRGLREATKIWALHALSDGTVISGDSLGNVQFWDGLFGTMLQTFSQSESGADVLCLAVSEDENKVFASGVDSRVMCIQRQALSSDDVANVNPDSVPIRKWVNVCAHRKHTHDVTALAICHKTASGSRKQLELLVSGSVDTRMCTYVTDDFRSSRPRIWFNWSSISPVSMSRECRLIAVTRSERIDLYRLYPAGATDEVKACEEADESKCHVKTISIESPFNLTCSNISNDGKFLAASDASTLYVFALNVVEEDGTVDVQPTKLHLPKGCGRPCTVLRFDPKGRLICATVDGSINILQLTPASSEDIGVAYTVSMEHVFKEHMSGVSYWTNNSPIVSLDVSIDGKWLAAARFSRGKGSVHVFSLEPFGHWWSLPEMEATSTCIKFLGGGTLAVGCSNNSFHTFNLQRRSLSDWSHDMGLPIFKSLPKEFISRTEPLSWILSIPSSDQKLILGSHGFFCVVDLDQPVPDKSKTFPPNSLRARRSVLYDNDDVEVYPSPSKKQKRPANDAINNFTMCLQYSNLLFQEFLNEEEMVVVEEPWMSILEELPDALARRVFGT